MTLMSMKTLLIRRKEHAVPFILQWQILMYNCPKLLSLNITYFNIRTQNISFFREFSFFCKVMHLQNIINRHYRERITTKVTYFFKEWI